MQALYFILLIIISTALGTLDHEITDVANEEDGCWPLEDCDKPKWWDLEGNGCENKKLSFGEFAHTYEGENCVTSSEYEGRTESWVLEYIPRTVFGRRLHTQPLDPYKPSFFTIAERGGIFFEILFHGTERKTTLECLDDRLIVRTAYGEDLVEKHTIVFRRRKNGEKCI